MAQILFVVLIVAGIVMIGVLWRSFEVLSDIKTSTRIIAKRVKEIDESIYRTQEAVRSMIESVKGFIFSLDFLKAIKEKFNKKGAEDE